MSATTRRPGARLIPDDVLVKKPTTKAKRRPAALQTYPWTTIAEAFEVIAVLDPKYYRAACALVIGSAASGIGFAGAWSRATPERQLAALAEVDRRRVAVASAKVGKF